GAYLGSVANALTASADGNSRSAIKVVSRGLPSSVFTFPLRDRYLPPCLCTMSCTEAAYAGTHPSSVTLISAITYTVIVFISCSRLKKNPVGLGPNGAVRGVIGHHRYELASPHSITSSARGSNQSGKGRSRICRRRPLPQSE